MCRTVTFHEQKLLARTAVMLPSDCAEKHARGGSKITQRGQALPFLTQILMMNPSQALPLPGQKP